MWNRTPVRPMIISELNRLVIVFDPLYQYRLVILMSTSPLSVPLGHRADVDLPSISTAWSSCWCRPPLYQYRLVIDADVDLPLYQYRLVIVLMSTSPLSVPLGHRADVDLPSISTAWSSCWCRPPLYQYRLVIVLMSTSPLSVPLGHRADVDLPSISTAWSSCWCRPPLYQYVTVVNIMITTYWIRTFLQT